MIDYQEHIPEKFKISVVIHDRISNEELITLWDLLHREFGAYDWSIVDGNVKDKGVKNATPDLCKSTNI